MVGEKSLVRVSSNKRSNANIEWFKTYNDPMLPTDLARAAESYKAQFPRNPINGCPFEVSGLKNFNRSFPTCKIYLIEDNEGDENDSVLGVRFHSWDNFYDYNAIQEVEVARFRHDVDVAVIKCLNTFGTLTTQVFGQEMIVSVDASKDKFLGDTGYDPTEVAIRLRNGTLMSVNKKTGQLSRLSKMFLQAGTKICIKMGYTNNEFELPIVFSGLVTEVQPGHVVTIVAQGHSAELTSVYSAYEVLTEVGGIEQVLLKMMGLGPGERTIGKTLSLLNILGNFLSETLAGLTFQRGLGTALLEWASIASFFITGPGAWAAKFAQGVSKVGKVANAFYKAIRFTIAPFSVGKEVAWRGMAGVRFLTGSAFKLFANVSVARVFAQEIENMSASFRSDQIAQAGSALLALLSTVVLLKWKGFKAIAGLKTGITSGYSQVAAAKGILGSVGTGAKEFLKFGKSAIGALFWLGLVGSTAGWLLSHVRYLTRQYMYIFRGILVPEEVFDTTMEALRENGSANTYLVIDLMMGHPALLHYGRFSVDAPETAAVKTAKAQLDADKSAALLRSIQKDTQNLSYILLSGSYWYRLTEQSNPRALMNVDPQLAKKAVKAGMDTFDTEFGKFYITNPGNASCFDIMYSALLRNPTHIITTRPYGADATLVVKQLGDKYITTDLCFAKGASFAKAADIAKGDKFFQERKSDILDILGPPNANYYFNLLYNLWVKVQRGLPITEEEGRQHQADAIQTPGLGTSAFKTSPKISSIPEMLMSRDHLIAAGCLGIHTNYVGNKLVFHEYGVTADKRDALVALYRSYVATSQTSNNLSRTMADAISIRPVCKVFYVSDVKNLIYNNINTNENIYNAVTFYDQETGDTNDTIKIDDSIVPNYVRALPVYNRDAISGGKGEQSGIKSWFGLDRSAMYAYLVKAATAFSILKETIGKMYQGEIAILGNGDIHPYDAIFLDDHMNHMKGKFLVDSIIHRFTPTEGFVSFIEPKLIVEISDTTQKLLGDRSEEVLTLLASDASYRAKAYKEESVGMGRQGSSYVDYEGMQALSLRLANRLRTGASITASVVGGLALGSTAGYLAYKGFGVGAGLGATALGAAAGIFLPQLINSEISEAITTDGWSLAKLGRNLLNPTGWPGMDRLISGFTGSLGTAFMNATMFRHPMMFYPLLVKGVPFIAGVRGLSHNTLADHYLGPLSALLSQLPGEIEMFKSGMRSYMKPVRHVIKSLNLEWAVPDSTPAFNPAAICEPNVSRGEQITVANAERPVK